MANKIAALTGNNAVAYAMRQINPDVVAAYPITPQTEAVEEFADFVANGLVQTEYIPVESEHSSMSACIGASAAGARVMTTTSSAGFALMWEMLPIAAGLRTPVIMYVANRAFSAPLNIHCSHDDTMGGRDTGWIQIYSENAQEVYDNMIQAVRIGEHLDVRLPVMVCVDGFIISHAVERVELLEDDVVRKFIGPYKAVNPLLDVSKPVTIGAIGLPDYYTEHKRQHSQAILDAKPRILEIAKEYAAVSGRQYGLFESYKLSDAEVAIVIINSAAGVAKMVIDELRAKGHKVGLLKPRIYRPFPKEEIRDALKHLKAVAVMDRTDAFGAGATPTATEVSAALYGLPKVPLMINYVYGLGGRDISPADIQGVYNRLFDIAKTGKITGKVFDYLNVRD
ncbi:MAG: pyruvate ferredoxin oxidoreductase [Planctomycetes bacterium]|nr:pyruvate ferredoxin oxidoreductase [Planctomycetota bacterium]